MFSASLSTCSPFLLSCHFPVSLILPFISSARSAVSDAHISLAGADFRLLPSSSPGTPLTGGGSFPRVVRGSSCQVGTYLQREHTAAEVWVSRWEFCAGSAHSQGTLCVSRG